MVSGYKLAASLSLIAMTAANWIAASLRSSQEKTATEKNGRVEMCIALREGQRRNAAPPPRPVQQACNNWSCQSCSRSRIQAAKSRKSSRFRWQMLCTMCQSMAS